MKKSDKLLKQTLTVRTNGKKQMSTDVLHCKGTSAIAIFLYSNL